MERAGPSAAPAEEPIPVPAGEPSTSNQSNESARQPGPAVVVRLKCGVCPLTFSKKRDLHVHVRSHGYMTIITCGNCGEKFRRKCDYMRHNALHTGEIHYNCQMCHKSFDIPQHLSNHEALHNRDRVYRCIKCKRSFVHRKFLNTHWITHHSEAARRAEANQPLEEPVDLRVGRNAGQEDND